MNEGAPAQPTPAPVPKPEKRAVAMHHENIPNTVKIETENGDYTIVYSNHVRMNDPHDLEGSDAIFLERGFMDFREEKQVRISINSQLEYKGPYTTAIKYAATHGIPLYFSDMSIKQIEENGARKIPMFRKIPALTGAEMMAGLFLAESGLKTFNRMPVSRRDALKGIGKMAAGAYLMSPAAELGTSMLAGGMYKHEPDETSIFRKAQRGLNNINEALHPELNHLLMHGRNIIIAEALESVSSTLHSKEGGKAHVSLIIGSDHVGIEGDIQSTKQQRYEKLRGYLTDDEIKDEGLVTRVFFEHKGGDKYDMNITNEKVDIAK